MEEPEKKNFFSVVQSLDSVPERGLMACSHPASLAAALVPPRSDPRLADRAPRSSSQPTDDPVESSEEEEVELQESAVAATHVARRGEEEAGNPAAAAGQSTDSSPAQVTRMDSRLKRLEEEVSLLGARLRVVEESEPTGTQTPVVAKRYSSGSSDEWLKIVTSEEETADTPRNPPTSDPSAVVVVSSAVPGSSSSTP
uniref:Uncharacterized protein n=1 Tax=Sphaerodactylus townsendi TaxID=933632 RepID=A0ACB8EXR0_9SAUR